MNDRPTTITDYQHLFGELAEVRKQRDALAEALQKCRRNAILIQNIHYGWGGDCGAVQIAVLIEDDCNNAFASMKGSAHE